MTIRKPGAKAIIIHGDKICLVLRDDNPLIAFPNTWNTPGGAIEENESPKKAILRELKEEIDLDATEIIELGKTTYTDGSVVFRYFVPTTEKEFQNIHLVHEGQRLDWFSFDDALMLDLSPHLRVYLEIFAEDVRKLLSGHRDFPIIDTTLPIV